VEEAAQMLGEEDNFVLALPLNAVLAQRLRLPSVDRAELSEMVRLQVEKALPFPADEVTTDYEIIDQANGDCVVSAVAVQNQRLSDLGRALLARNAIPRAVTIYAAHRVATHAGNGRALLIYPESGSLVSAIAENGKLSFARTMSGGVNGPLEAELPQFAMTAELEGIDTSFQNVIVDEKCFGLREMVGRTLGSKIEIVGIETPPADTAINLLPQEWRNLRDRRERQGQWRKRVKLGLAIYCGIIALSLLHLVYLKVRAGQLDRQIRQDAPRAASVQRAAADWRSLEPALEPQFYPIGLLLSLYDSLPSPDVRITAYNQSARQISVEGEAKSTALAYQFAEKVKKNPSLARFIFEMPSPRILPNDHAQFRLEGKPR